MLVSLKKNEVDMFRIALFQLLLQETTSMLIFTESQNLSLQLFQLDICETSILCKTSQ